MVGVGAADRGLPTGGQDGAVASAAEDGSDHLSACERGEVAVDPGGAGSVVDGGADVYPLVAVGGQRLPGLAQDRAVRLGMVFLDGTSIRAHAKAAGAAKKGEALDSGTCVRRLADLVAVLAQRPASPPRAAAER